MGSLRAGIKARLFADSGEAPSMDPARIGRYVVIKRIGAGGIGLVYAAYDDKLDRKVAVKLLRPGHGRVSQHARQRLLREAQAIARLSHRSVIQVYEVGTHHDEVFVAMEYVEGSTLKQWQPSRDWRDILARYLEAGRGLCAAHAAGIVHRDFKADNVLVRASDLAVRVVDFGLARTDGPILDPATTEDVAAPIEDDAAEDPSLTRSGVIMGTPAYMAPEQHAALATDTRTDQFSFCASLFEALYGYRAFAGERLDELRSNVLEGKVEPAPRYTTVPPQVHRALARGLSVEPAKRYPTMEALLDDLRLAAPTRPWRRVVGAVVLSVAGVMGLVSWSGARDETLIAESMQIRGAYEEASRSTAQEELDRIRGRDTTQRWNDLVLDYAARSSSPSTALAALGHLSPEAPDWIHAARALAADAIRKGPVFATFTAPADVQRLSFAPGSKRLAAVTDAGEVLQWTVDGPTQGQPVSLDREAVDAAFTGDGTLRVALKGGRVVSFAPGDAHPSARDELGSEISCIATDAADQWAVGLEDGRVMLHTGARVKTLAEHAAPVSALTFAPQAATLASGDTSGRLTLWFLDRSTHRTASTSEAIGNLTWVPETGVVVAETDRGLLTWDGEKGIRTKSPFSRASRHVAAQRDVRLEYDEAGLTASHGPASRLVLEHSDGLDALALSPDGTWAAAAAGSEVHLWRTGSDALGFRAAGDRRVALPEGGEIVGLHVYDGYTWAVNADGRVFAVDDDGRFALVTTLTRSVRSVSASSRGDRLALEASDGEISVLDLETPERAARLGSIEDPQPGAMHWSGDDTTLVKLNCGTESSTCGLSLHPTDGSAATTLGTTGGLPDEVHVSGDGASVAIRHGRQVVLWSVSSQTRFVPENGRRPLAAVFQESGSLRIASYDPGSGAATLHVGQVGKTGTLHPLFEQDGLQRVLATANADAIVLVTADERVLLWPLRADAIVRLPEDILGDIAEPEVHLSPSGTQLWVSDESSARAVLFDLRTGQRQTLPRPLATRTWFDSGWVDVIGHNELRMWGGASPSDPDAFLRWLETRTRVELPLGALREPVSSLPKPL